MSAFKFDLYELKADGAKALEPVDLNTETDSPATVQAELNKVLELKKNNKIWIAPLNAESAAVLLKPAARGRRVELAAEVVRFMHDKFVNDRMSIKQIPFEVHNKFKGLIVKDNIVKSVLAQERATDVTGIDELRVKALELKPAQNNRRKHSDEDKAEWVRMHVEDRMTGSQIAEQVGINSATINKHLKESGQQWNAKGQNQVVTAKQVS